MGQKSDAACTVIMAGWKAAGPEAGTEIVKSVTVSANDQDACLFGNVANSLLQAIRIVIVTMKRREDGYGFYTKSRTF